MLSAFRDRSGVLWFGTYEGVSRFIPSPEAAEPAPPVFVNAVSTAGGPAAIADLGATTVDGITLPPDQRQIQIEFGGLPLGSATRCASSIVSWGPTATGLPTPERETCPTRS